MAHDEDEVQPKNFYIKVYFANQYLGTYVIAIPGSVPENLVPIAMLQAEEKLIRQNLRTDLMDEKDYLREVAGKTTIVKKEGE